VVRFYVRDHAAGVTPNPCIECNRHVKFDRLLRRAEQLGFDAVATGHHARIGRDHAGRFTLERGADPAKDQSYVVHMLDQDDLRRTRFPVGHIDKTEVRRLAGEMGLRTATKPDSQDVCFITSTGGRSSFLGDRIAFRPGTVVDRSGTTLGEVDAVEMVTVGQRRGIGLPGGGPKRYVLDVDVPNAVVTVGADDEMYRSSLTVCSPTWVDEPVDGAVLVQCSAHGAVHAAAIRSVDDGVLVEWSETQRRIAPGQSVVFYDRSDQRVLGGGVAVR